MALGCDEKMCNFDAYGGLQLNYFIMHEPGSPFFFLIHSFPKDHEGLRGGP